MSRITSPKEPPRKSFAKVETPFFDYEAADLRAMEKSKEIHDKGLNGKDALKAMFELMPPGASKPNPNQLVSDDRAAELREKLREILNPHRLNAEIEYVGSSIESMDTADTGCGILGYTEDLSIELATMPTPFDMEQSSDPADDEA